MKQMAYLLSIGLLAAPVVPATANQDGGPYADRVVSLTLGNPASEVWNDPGRVLGPPDFNEANGTGWLTLGVGGSVTVEFVDNVAVDGPGPDIEIVGDPGNDEGWIVEVSMDGQAFHSFGLVSENATLDLAALGLVEARYVRVTDDGDPSGGASPGAELDAVVALNSRSPTEEAPTSTPVTAPTEPSAAPTSSASDGGSPLVGREWVRLGGPLGGLGYDIRMDPRNPDVMHVTDAFAGIHASTDGGLTWFPSNEGITARTGDSGDLVPAFCLTIDPNDPDIVWAGMQSVGQVYRSADGGRTWQERDEGIIEGQGLSIRGITIEPGNSNVVYAAGEISSWVWAGEDIRGFFDLTQGVVYKSTDGGETWQAIWRGDNLARYVWIDPRDADTLYVSTGIFDRDAANSDPVSWRQGNPIPGGVGILKSADGGLTWRTINEGLENLYIGSLFMHPENPDVLLAGAGHWVSYGLGYFEGSGVYLTTDGGAHWDLVQRTHDGEPITSVEFSLGDTEVAYAGGGHHFYRSEDGGRTWRLLLRPNGRWGPLGASPGIPIDFQVDPRDPMRLFSNNYGGGNFLSEDGGQTWVSASTGYSGADIREVAVHPSNPAIVYAVGLSGPFVSTDGGLHWRGLTPERLELIAVGEAIALDPHAPDTVVMADADMTWIYWSPDAGSSWQEAQYLRTTNQAEMPLDRGLGGLVAIAFSPARPGKVYGGYGHNTCSRGGEACGHRTQFSVITSEDGGRTWQPQASVPGDGLPVSAVVAHPADAEVAWLAVPEGGVYRTGDGGVSWAASMSGLESRRVMSLAVDPRDPAVLYAGTYRNGLFRSADGGATWQASSAGMDPNEPVFALVVDPVRTAVVYAGSLRSGVFVSEDGGRTWRPLSQGLHNRTVRGLTIAADGQTLYAAAHGGGVYRLSTLSQEQFDALAPGPGPAVTAAAPPDSTPTRPPSPAVAAAAPTITPQPAPAEPSPPPTPTPQSSDGGGGLCGGAAALPLLLAGMVRLTRPRRLNRPGTETRP